VLEVVDRFAPAQAAAEPDGFQSRLADVKSDTFRDDRHATAFVSRFKF
jgi:hypothetical protein